MKNTKYVKKSESLDSKMEKGQEIKGKKFNGGKKGGRSGWRKKQVDKNQSENNGDPRLEQRTPFKKIITETIEHYQPVEIEKGRDEIQSSAPRVTEIPIVNEVVAPINIPINDDETGNQNPEEVVLQDPLHSVTPNSEPMDYKSFKLPIKVYFELRGLKFLCVMFVLFCSYDVILASNSVLMSFVSATIGMAVGPLMYGYFNKSFAYYAELFLLWEIVVTVYLVYFILYKLKQIKIRGKLVVSLLRTNNPNWFEPRDMRSDVMRRVDLRHPSSKPETMEISFETSMWFRFLYEQTFLISKLKYSLPFEDKRTKFKYKTIRREISLELYAQVHNNRNFRMNVSNDVLQEKIQRALETVNGVNIHRYCAESIQFNTFLYAYYYVLSNKHKLDHLSFQKVPLVIE
jgi:hypothetical protein